MSSSKSRTQAFLEKIGLVERDPSDLVKEWTREIRKEQRALDRQLRQIEREEAKMKRDIKMLAKKNELDAIRPLARAIVEAKKAKERIHVAKANMNSVMLEMKFQAASLKQAKALQSSTKVMKAMNKLMNIQEVSKTVRDMTFEMEKAGLIQEMMDETMDMAFDTEGLDEAVDEEVDKVISELTLGILNTAPVTPNAAPVSQKQLAENGKKLFVSSLSGDEERVPVAIGDEEDDLDRRLAALQG